MQWRLDETGGSEQHSIFKPLCIVLRGFFVYPDSGMKLLKPSILVFMLLGLPLAGVWVAGHDVTAYLEFPPQTQYVDHAPFSWPVFVGLSVGILIVVLPFLLQVIAHNLRGALTRTSATPSDNQTSTGNGPRSGTSATTSGDQTVAAIHDRGHFPWWGWIAVGLCGHFWILAWTRQLWFAPYQPYTFTPLWIAYIVVLNALTWRRTGRCLLTHDTLFFLKLFPLSAVFWWFFEYLNRFVQNWWYVLGAEFTPLQYFLAATLPFSTVLPAVLSTEEWLATHPRCTAGLDHFVPIRFAKPKSAAWLTLTLSGAGLFLIGWFPNQLFPLLWVAPLLLLIAFQPLADRAPFFPEVAGGDWQRIYRFGLAALICGFFWEMWNLHSLAKWIYSVPYVDRFHLFEMPLLGYTGYLPFGLECAVIAELFLKRQK